MVSIKKTQFVHTILASDVAIFTIRDNDLKVFLMKMKKPPFQKAWALPGGLVSPKESVDAAATRILLEKTRLKNVYLQQLHTFGRINRDPFGRVVSVGYLALIPEKQNVIQEKNEASNFQWFSLKRLPTLAYDHAEIIDVAIHALREKLGVSNIVYSLLPKQFTLTELQLVYEIILNKSLDKRNFRKKILSQKILRKTNRLQKGNPNRPAELYEFSKRSPMAVDML